MKRESILAPSSMRRMTAVLFGLSALSALVLTQVVSQAAKVHETTCSLPEGIELESLDRATRRQVALRSLLCAELRDGVIDRASYLKERAELVAPRAEQAAKRVAAPATPVWADRVVSFSSQYGDGDWSAKQTLGAPNVFPRSGDDVHAWAPLERDGGREELVLAFATPTSAGAIAIFETYNPGAVERVEVTTGDGTVVTTTAVDTLHHTGARRSHWSLGGCSEVVSVRVVLDTKRAPGWNEIDAVAAMPCAHEDL